MPSHDADYDSESYDDRYRDDSYQTVDADPVERFVDDLMPEGVEWRRLVTTYPRSSLAVAATAGFLLGRNRGLALLGALSGFVVHQVGENVESFLADWME